MIVSATFALLMLGPAEPAPSVEPAPPTASPEPSPEPIVVPAPEQVQDAAESGAGPVPPPEQVRDQSQLQPGQQPPAPPNPRARPSEGVYAVGSSGVAPLPAPPPPVSPEAITRGRWSGFGWLSVRLLVSGPIAGHPPARPTVISLGGGAEGGWRIRQWIGLGAAFTRQPHEVYREDVPDAPAVVDYRGYMSVWDVAFVRLFAPVRGRVDPFLDVGGGLAFFDPARNRPTLVGGSVRAAVGFEAWVGRNLTLGLSGIYRANFVDDTVGHGWQAAIDFGVHW
ncbi:MAG TPA: hypothetical protein VK034_19755 [Enhygromyxa sp.]|nr:hypothetical protein [Enhygromyxa sp.]